jgi:hypothetical protein
MVRASRLRHSSLLLGFGIYLLPSLPAALDVRPPLLFSSRRLVLLLKMATLSWPGLHGYDPEAPSRHWDDPTTDDGPRC